MNIIMPGVFLRLLSEIHITILIQISALGDFLDFRTPENVFHKFIPWLVMILFFVITQLAFCTVQGVVGRRGWTHIIHKTSM